MCKHHCQNCVVVKLHMRDKPPCRGTLCRCRKFQLYVCPFEADHLIAHLCPLPL